MEQKNLEELLAEFRASRGPELPGAFAQDVLREIRLRRAAKERNRGWWNDFLAIPLRPAAIAASLGIAMAVGAALPFLTPSSVSVPASRESDMSIFSGSATDIPSGLLARIR